MRAGSKRWASRDEWFVITGLDYLEHLLMQVMTKTSLSVAQNNRLGYLTPSNMGNAGGDAEPFQLRMKSLELSATQH